MSVGLVQIDILSANPVIHVPTVVICTTPVFALPKTKFDSHVGGVVIWLAGVIRIVFRVIIEHSVMFRIQAK
jgi:hypothetical protein